MWLDLLERILAFILAIILGISLGCTLLSPPTQKGPEIDQQTTATQQTVQAAPDSVVNLGANPRPASGTGP